MKTKQNTGIRQADLAAGTMQCVQLGEQRVLLVNDAGSLYAVSPDCPHEDAPFTQGYIKNGNLHCPLHGSFFDLKTGRVMADPAEDDLQTYELQVEGGYIHVSC